MVSLSYVTLLISHINRIWVAISIIMTTNKLIRVAKLEVFVKLMEIDLIAYNQDFTTRKLSDACKHAKGITLTIKSLLKKTLKSNKSIKEVKIETKKSSLK